MPRLNEATAKLLTMKAGLACASAGEKDLEFPNEGLQCGSVIEPLPGIHKALGSTPRTTKKGGWEEIVLEQQKALVF